MKFPDVHIIMSRNVVDPPISHEIDHWLPVGRSIIGDAGIWPIWDRLANWGLWLLCTVQKGPGNTLS